MRQTLPGAGIGPEKKLYNVSQAGVNSTALEGSFGGLEGKKTLNQYKIKV